LKLNTQFIRGFAIHRPRAFSIINLSDATGGKIYQHLHIAVMRIANCEQSVVCVTARMGDQVSIHTAIKPVAIKYDGGSTPPQFFCQRIGAAHRSHHGGPGHIFLCGHCYLTGAPLFFLALRVKNHAFLDEDRKKYVKRSVDLHNFLVV
jgi:hypothetical protein